MAKTQARTPRMEPSEEATAETLQMAREQGQALEKALQHMTRKEAHDGGELPAGDYLIAYAVENAEGLHELRGDRLEWIEPQEENCHLEVCVRDAADGRFIPALDVTATLIDANGKEVGTHRQPFLWHPWLYHYGRNWKVPGDGEYTLRVRIEPPRFGRHDKINGDRFREPVEATFDGVKIKTGKK